MKKICFALLLLPFCVKAQNTYTVCNLAGVSSNYKTLQGAHDSVPAGSTLYVLPSPFSYGTLTLTKRLTIYGTGYLLGQNFEPNTQAGTSPVILAQLHFRPGSDNSYAEGLQIAENNSNVNRVVIDTASGIIISRCFIRQQDQPGSYFYLRGANNCTVKQCYLLCGSGFYSHYLLYADNPASFSGILFSNNIIDFAPIGGNGFFMYNYLYNGTYNALFQNNTFYIDIRDSQFGNLDFTNNIFVNTVNNGTPNPATLLLGGTNLNNITGATQMFPTPGNNFQGANTDSMFVATLPGYHSADQRAMLRDTSFANTFGQGGIAVGAYGNANPYKLSGIPNLPYIYNLSVPAQATAPGTISVHIKAKASN